MQINLLLSRAIQCIRKQCFIYIEIVVLDLKLSISIFFLPESGFFELGVANVARESVQEEVGLLDLAIHFDFVLNFLSFVIV